MLLFPKRQSGFGEVKGPTVETIKMSHSLSPLKAARYVMHGVREWEEILLMTDTMPLQYYGVWERHTGPREVEVRFICKLSNTHAQTKIKSGCRVQTALLKQGFCLMFSNGKEGNLINLRIEETLRLSTRKSMHTICMHLYRKGP